MDMDNGVGLLEGVGELVEEGKEGKIGTSVSMINKM